MNIPNAKVLGINKNFNFFGDAVFRFQTESSVSIEGYVLDLLNTAGVSGVISGVEELSSYLYNAELSEIIINGQQFGSGYIESLDFSSNNDVRLKEYSLSLKCFDSGNLFNLVGANYNGVDSSEFWKFESISENFSTNRNGKTFEFEHSIDVVPVYPTGLSAIDLCRSVAENLFENASLQTDLLWQTGTGFVKNDFYTESYDSINNNCSFSRSFSSVSGVTGYLVSRVIAVDYVDNGVTNVTENASYQGKSDNYNLVIQNLRSDLSGSYDRCNDVFAAYIEADNYDLIDRPLSKSVSQNENEGLASYSLVFTNDWWVRPEAFWEYTHEVNLNNQNLQTITEAGQIVGFGEVMGEMKSLAAETYWLDSIRPNINTRINLFYLNHKIVNKAGAPPLFLLSTNVQKGNRNGVVSYSYVYSDDLNQDPELKLVKIGCSKQDRTRLSSNVIVPNHVEIKQINPRNANGPDPIWQFSNYNLDIGMIGDATKDLNYYIGKFPEYLQSGCLGDMVARASYSYSPDSHNFEASIETVKIHCPE
jgi:hypothetical protein